MIVDRIHRKERKTVHPGPKSLARAWIHESRHFAVQEVHWLIKTFVEEFKAKLLQS